MKKTFFLALAATAMIAAGCNKENVAGPEQGFPQNPDGTAYMSLAINLPSVPGTKANDNFDDGNANEYAVESAYLLIFAGTPDASFTNESEMTLRSAYELNSVNFEKDNLNNQITTSKTVTAQILTANIAATETAFAFVILNKHDFFTLDGSDLKQGGTSLIGKTFGVFKGLLLDEHNKDFSNQSFTMTNMPHIHKTGMAANPYNSAIPAPWTLVRIEKSKVKNNAADAQGDPAAVVDVERVVAKVSVRSSLTGSANAVTNHLFKYGTTTEVNFEILGWFIDNTNQYTYVTRNTAEPNVGTPYAYLGYKSSTSAYYRMASANMVHYELDNVTPVVRTYWGVDTNYDEDATGMKTEAGKIVDNTVMVFDASHALISGRLRALNTDYYCAENTFDVAHQTVKNTTRVIVATRFNGGTSFFTFHQAPGYIYTAAELEKQVKALLLARVNVSNWVNEYVISSATEEQLLSLFNVTVTGLGAGSAAEGTATIDLALANDTVLTPLVKGGKTLADMKSAWTSIYPDQAAYISENITKSVSYYETGVSYYQSLIRHFDDTETNWVANTSMSNNTASIYDGNNAQDYLGRYGVLRNNWYDINVTSVKALGSPVVPALTDDPDDTVESYIAVKINVMPWAKRTQDVAL